MQNNAVMFFAKFIEKELGIIYAEFNYFQLNNRLEEIAKMKSFKSVEDLYLSAQKSMEPDLKQLVLDTATNNETSFFRDQKLFDTVKNNIIPQLMADSHGAGLKIWSAACSSGQEPYSLSILLNEHREAAAPSFSYDIVASDISSRVLEKAQTARYMDHEVQRGMPLAWQNKYFDRAADGTWSLKAIARQPVKFQKLNLLDSFTQMGKFDLIFCRNVMIYQNVENKKKIIQKFISCMSDKSILVLGAGESMIGLSDDFDSVKIGDAIVYRLKPKASIKIGA